jgi:Flp pilus assembly protein TadB
MVRRWKINYRIEELVAAGAVRHGLEERRMDRRGSQVGDPDGGPRQNLAAVMVVVLVAAVVMVAVVVVAAVVMVMVVVMMATAAVVVVMAVRHRRRRLMSSIDWFVDCFD